MSDLTGRVDKDSQGQMEETFQMEGNLKSKSYRNEDGDIEPESKVFQGR